jgi:DNA-binding MarR family transcriptional regulator
MSESISLYDYQALAAFRFQIRCFLHFSEKNARAVGLEPQQHQLMLAIKGLPVGKQATIGEHHSTVELINRSTKRGLVQRRRDEIDQRRVLVDLTSYGEEVLRELSKHNLNELRTRGPALVQALNDMLESGNMSTTPSQSQVGMEDRLRE